MVFVPHNGARYLQLFNHYICISFLAQYYKVGLIEGQLINQPDSLTNMFLLSSHQGQNCINSVSQFQLIGWKIRSTIWEFKHEYVRSPPSIVMSTCFLSVHVNKCVRARRASERGGRRWWVLAVIRINASNACATVGLKLDSVKALHVIRKPTAGQYYVMSQYSKNVDENSRLQQHPNVTLKIQGCAKF